MTETAEDWRFDVAIEHGPHRTRAQLVLHAPDGHEFSGVGFAHRTGTVDVGSYLAIGRAMSDLTEELLEAVAVDVELEVNRAMLTGMVRPA
ncbi:MAG TPA: dsRBD fold-containing protein [Amycolatopsis sp.]|nr:dsRBD fold-containing protein [Amycolatopsis sp.]